MRINEKKNVIFFNVDQLVFQSLMTTTADQDIIFDNENDSFHVFSHSDPGNPFVFQMGYVLRSGQSLDEHTSAHSSSSTSSSSSSSSSRGVPTPSVSGEHNSSDLSTSPLQVGGKEEKIDESLVSNSRLGRKDSFFSAHNTVPGENGERFPLIDRKCLILFHNSRLEKERRQFFSRFFQTSHVREKMIEILNRDEKKCENVVGDSALPPSLKLRNSIENSLHQKENPKNDDRFNDEENVWKTDEQLFLTSCCSFLESKLSGRLPRKQHITNFCRDVINCCRQDHSLIEIFDLVIRRVLAVHHSSPTCSFKTKLEYELEHALISIEKFVTFPDDIWLNVSDKCLYDDFDLHNLSPLFHKTCEMERKRKRISDENSKDKVRLFPNVFLKGIGIFVNDPVCFEDMEKRIQSICCPSNKTRHVSPEIDEYDDFLGDQDFDHDEDDDDDDKENQKHHVEDKGDFNDDKELKEIRVRDGDFRSVDGTVKNIWKKRPKLSNWIPKLLTARFIPLDLIPQLLCCDVSDYLKENDVHLPIRHVVQSTYLFHVRFELVLEFLSQWDAILRRSMFTHPKSSQMLKFPKSSVVDYRKNNQQQTRGKGGKFPTSKNLPETVESSVFLSPTKRANQKWISSCSTTTMEFKNNQEMIMSMFAEKQKSNDQCFFPSDPDKSWKTTCFNKISGLLEDVDLVFVNEGHFIFAFPLTDLMPPTTEELMGGGGGVLDSSALTIGGPIEHYGKNGDQLLLLRRRDRFSPKSDRFLKKRLVDPDGTVNWSEVFPKPEGEKTNEHNETIINNRTMNHSLNEKRNVDLSFSFDSRKLDETTNPITNKKFEEEECSMMKSFSSLVSFPGKEENNIFWIVGQITKQLTGHKRKLYSMKPMHRHLNKRPTPIGKAQILSELLSTLLSVPENDKF